MKLRSLRERFPGPCHVVVLTGAGISVASGLRPYRGPGGLWTANPELAKGVVAGIDPQALWGLTCAWRNEVFAAAPNDAHRALAAFEQQVEREGGTFTLITQNIDGLHLRAGSSNVIELHGALRRSRCSNTGCDAMPFEDTAAPVGETVPKCTKCRAPIRPDIVLFDEMLGAQEEWSAKKALREVELFVAIGTSGTVSPASNYVRAARYVGAHTILLNLEVPEMEEGSPFLESHAGEAVALVPAFFA